MTNDDRIRCTGMLDELIATAGVREELTLAGPIGVMALHGGLESGTAEAARKVATATGASHYAIVQPHDMAWHIPSIAHNPTHSEKLRLFLEHVALAVSFHGFGRRHQPNTVLVGGRNRRFAKALGESIEGRTNLRVITEPGEMPRGLTGMHPDNPVNLPGRGGAQLELSRGARSPEHLPAIVAAVTNVIVAEMGSVDRNPSLS